MKGFIMSDITPEAEEPRSRTARFYGAWAFSLAAAIFLSVAGGAVTPLTSLGAAAVAPPAADAPADPVPAEPGVAATEPSAPPAAADTCATGTDAFTVRVCAATSSLGWTVSATSAELAPGVAFTVLDETGQPPIAVGGTFEVTSLAERSTLMLAHKADGVVTADVVGLPAQSDASLATDIRAALGVPEVFFFNGTSIVDGPDLSVGQGWMVATAHDPARVVGEAVTVGWVTLTVTQSDPVVGTVYALS